jgi:hypothetical protein
MVWVAQKGCRADLAGTGNQQYRELPGSFLEATSLERLSRVRVKYMKGQRRVDTETGMAFNRYIDKNVPPSPHFLADFVGIFCGLYLY